MAKKSNKGFDYEDKIIKKLKELQKKRPKKYWAF
jgi:hypothetical protein|tara:strand:+ start:354 stop:455 length:102 start_codon:yes stop_codon:yes gene_type:complete